MKTDSIYRAYLLRLRYVDQAEHDDCMWRISLEEAGSGQEKIYTTLDALFIYLSSQLHHVEKSHTVRFKYKEDSFEDVQS